MDSVLNGVCTTQEFSVRNGDPVPSGVCTMQQFDFMQQFSVKNLDPVLNGVCTTIQQQKSGPSSQWCLHKSSVSKIWALFSMVQGSHCLLEICVNQCETLHILHQRHKKCIWYNLELTHIIKPKWWSNLIVSSRSITWADKNSKKVYPCTQKMW